MKSTIKRTQRNVYARRAKEIQRSLSRLGQQASQAGEAHALAALNLGVYSTTPGQYVRTGHARESLSFSVQSNATSIGILAVDTAEYASHIEYGTGPSALSQVQLDAYLKAMPPGGMLNFGRSGKAYLLPQPFVSVGLRQSQHVLQGEMQALLRRLWS